MPTKKSKKDVNPSERGLLKGIPEAAGSPYGGLPILYIDDDVLGVTAIKDESGEAMAIVINNTNEQGKLRLHRTLLHEFIHVAEQHGIKEGVFEKAFEESQVEYLAEYLLGLLCTSDLYKPIGQKEFLKLNKEQ